MIRLNCDIAVIGSGFGGTLLAIIAKKIGLKVALLERGTHPRFAIGESSTPLADFKLTTIADRFGLDWLRPFSKYGTWKARYPDIRCGMKRGFSFFKHRKGDAFRSNDANDNMLMVAASPNASNADTHWFRSDFDAYLISQALASGVEYFDQCTIRELIHGDGWSIACQRLETEMEIRAAFVVDATGDGRVLSGALPLSNVSPSSLRARSRALYSHFSNVAPWHDVIRQSVEPDVFSGHPFPCDAAALHHIIDAGWMWVLRFDNGITSAGFSLDPMVHPQRPNESAEAEWQRLLQNYPSLAQQFREARALRPFTQTERLQRRVTQAAGEDWALLPHAAGFLDPWLSPGIAQTLFAVERLGRILSDWHMPGRTVQLLEYSRTVIDELIWMDEITGACFECFDRFEVMVSVAMVYFVAAIHCEERERAGNGVANAAFLLADDKAYRREAAAICSAAPRVPASDAQQFADEVRRKLHCYNQAGLCDPRRRNLYPYISKMEAAQKI